MELPYLEDIYDFGEQELNEWKTKVTHALETYVPGSNDKWEWKARRVQELIQTELDERISINQISLFCFKELNSKLYQEVHSEVQPLSDTQGSETAETASNLPSEESVASTAWQPRTKMGKKEYQQYIRDKLRSTQVSSGVVIGGSSVPQTKAPTARTKSSERAKPEAPIKAKPSVEKSATAGRKTPVKSSVSDTRSSQAPAKSRTLPPTKPAKEEVKTAGRKPRENGSSAQAKVTKGSADIGKKGQSEEGTNSGKTSLGRGTKSAEKGTVIQSAPKAKHEDFSSAASKEPPTAPSTTLSPDHKPAASAHESVSLPPSDTVSYTAEVDTEPSAVGSVLPTPSNRLSEVKSEGRNVEEQDYESSSDGAEGERTEEEGKMEEPASHSQTTDSEYTSRKQSLDHPLAPTAIETAAVQVESETALMKGVQPAERLSLEEKRADAETNPIASVPEQHISPSISTPQSIAIPEPALTPSHQSHQPSIHEEAKESVAAESDSDEADDTPEATVTFSVGKSVITATSNLPPVTLKPRPAPRALESIPESTEEAISTAKSPKVEPALKTEAASQGKSEEPVDKPPVAKKPPRSSIPKPVKPPPKPKPPVRASTAPVEDYSDIYHTIADVFNGGKLKDFDLIAAVRNCLSMFQDLEDQMSAPDFEFQRSFKFALAPLEMDPRDFLRNGGHFDMDTSMKPPSDSEMYYRVVRAKQEVYDIVTRSFLKKSGWTELPHGMSLRCSWNIMWTWSKPRVDFSKLLVWQRVNHFPNSKQFSRKDNLKRNIERVAKLSAKCAQAWNIAPPTFILPKEYVAFCDEFAKGCEEEYNFWIMKPVGKSRGRGISLIKDITEVAYSEPMVIQKYVKHPLLLGGFKFDLRIYVLITGINPLEVFLYKEGFARMSTSQYTLNPDKISNKFVHLTNSSIQKHNHNSQGDSLDHSFGGTKISLETLRQRLKFQGVDFEVIWQQVREIIVKSMLAVQYEMEHTPSCFDLVGYDILIDASLKAWLIEINSSPSLARDNVLDDMVKQTLIDETLDLIDPLPFNRKKLIKVLERRLAELQKGNVGSMSQLNADVSEVLGPHRPRRYGEMPQKMGNYERIAPSAMMDQYQKLMSAGSR